MMSSSGQAAAVLAPHSLSRQERSSRATTYRWPAHADRCTSQASNGEQALARDWKLSQLTAAENVSLTNTSAGRSALMHARRQAPTATLASSNGMQGALHLQRHNVRERDLPHIDHGDPRVWLGVAEQKITEERRRRLGVCLGQARSEHHDRVDRYVVVCAAAAWLPRCSLCHRSSFSHVLRDLLLST